MREAIPLAQAMFDIPSDAFAVSNDHLDLDGLEHKVLHIPYNKAEIIPSSNLFFREMFFEEEGFLHNLKGSALVIRDMLTGLVVAKECFKHGNRHREDGPALVLSESCHGSKLRS